MRLADLQQAVQAHVLDGGEVPASLLAAVAAPAEERWRIYSDGYRLRLIEALAAQYPVLAARLGREAFGFAMRDFVDATPSVHRSIRDYGGDLAGYLAASAHDVENRLCAELAAFEWCLAGAFDAPHSIPTAPADLATVAPEEWATLGFRAVPSVRRLQSGTNAVAVWRALKAGIEGSATTAGELPAAEATHSVDWLIYRRHLDVEFRSCAPGEAMALDLLTNGASFGELCGVLADAGHESPALQAAGWLKGWLLEEILARR